MRYEVIVLYLVIITLYEFFQRTPSSINLIDMFVTLLHVSTKTMGDIDAMGFTHKCPDCSRTFPAKRGMTKHLSRWSTKGDLNLSVKGITPPGEAG